MTDTANIQTISGKVPSKSNSYKVITVGGHGSLAKHERLKAYERSFYLQCDKYRNAGISSLFEFYVDVYYPSNRADLDNSLKIILDCLQQCKAINNDNLCVKIVARKFVDKENPRIEFRIEKL